jgi:hypothetical protein
LGDTEDWNDVSGQWYNKWPLKTSVDSPIFRWLRDTILAIFVNEPVEYPKPDEDDASNEALLHKPDCNKSPLPRAPPPPQKALLFCPLPGQVRHLKLWLTKCFADHLDIFYMYAEMGNDEPSEMQLKFHDSPIPSVLATTPKVPHTRLLSTGRSGYDNRVSDLHQVSGVAQMKVLHGLMSRPKITTSMIYWILECRKDHRKQLTEYGDIVPSDGKDKQ